MKAEADLAKLTNIVEKCDWLIGYYETCGEAPKSVEALRAIREHAARALEATASTLALDNSLSQDTPQYRDR